MELQQVTELAEPQPTQPQPTQPPETLTTYVDFSVTRLSCTPPEQKQIPGTGPNATPPSAPQHYHQIPVLYNFGTQDNRILNEFIIEGCEMESKSGIQSKTGPSGRSEHSIMCSFDINNPDQARFIETMSQIHGGCAYILQQFKGAVKLPHFNAGMAEATGLKNPVYRPRDEVSGEPIQGRSPSIFWKLFSRGKPPLVEQTLFTDLEAKPIPWNLLTSVNMKFIPLIHVKRIYIGGGKASIQMEVISAIVTETVARNTTTRQTGTIERLKQARPELADKVAAQLAKLTAERLDQMLGAAVPQHAEMQTGEAQPTFAGIAPTGQRQPAQQTLPAMPTLMATPTMQDFTATAPVRPPVIPAVTLPVAQKVPSPTVQLG